MAASAAEEGLMNAKLLTLRLPAAVTTLVLTLFLAACGGGQGAAVSPSSADTTQASGAGSEALPAQAAAVSDQVAPAATMDTEDGSWKWTTGRKPSTTTYALSVIKAGLGTINSSPAGIACGTDCSEAYASGTTVTLTAVPASGYAFKGWGGACAGTSPNCSVAMTATRSVTATFEAIVTTPINPTTYILSVATSGAGTVNSSPAGIACGSDCSESYASGTAVGLTAIPASGYAFKGWSGACTGTSPSCNVAMTVARSVVATFESTTTTPISGSIDEIVAAMPANSWKALPATQMKDICPPPYNSYACSSVIAAWSGGAYDESRDRMIVYGGGHADSWYNNVFAFDLPEMRWKRLTEMSGGATGSTPGIGWTDKRVETCGFYPKGELSLPDTVMNGTYVSYDKCFVEPVVSQLDLQQPRSSHTYGGVFVDRKRDLYCYIGTAAYYPSGQSSSPVAVCYSPVTGQWSRMADKPAGVGGRGQTALDAAGHMWTVAGEQGKIAEYDPDTNTWKSYGLNNYDAGGGTDIDRKRNHLYVMFQKVDGSYAMRRWNIGLPTSLTASPTYTEIATNGTAPIGLGSRPGFAYVDRRDQFFAWGGGRDVYAFNPATATWSRLAATGDDPGIQQKWGTYGRFRYSPTRGVFVLVNDVGQNVYIYKPPA